MLKRKIYDKLVEWKRQSDGATALLIDGARRVGKSYIAEEFAKHEYQSYILIDFGKALKIYAPPAKRHHQCHGVIIVIHCTCSVIPEVSSVPFLLRGLK